MYEDYYQLKRPPFNTTPDTHFLYLSPSHEEAYAGMLFGIMYRKGIIELVGEVGTGKTTVLRSALESDQLTNTKIIYVFNPVLSYGQLLAKILMELSERIPSRTHLAVEQLQQALLREYKQGNNVVLVIDEAQNMPTKTLERMRILSNIETASEKLFQIVLCGQPELDKKIASHKLRQLKDRIAIKIKFNHLTEEESVHYIEHRLRVAGSNETLFSPAAMKTIVTHSQGNPRRINVLCDMCLVTGFGYQAQTITQEIVEEVIEDFRPIHESSQSKFRTSKTSNVDRFRKLFRFWN